MRIGSLRVTRRATAAIAMMAMALVLVRTACASWNMGVPLVAGGAPAVFASEIAGAAGTVAPCCTPGGACAGAIAQSACGDAAEAKVLPTPMASAPPLVVTFDVPALSPYDSPRIPWSFHERSARIRV